jgi:hypothetical protein
MTRNFFLGVAASSMLLASAVSATAQSTPESTQAVSATAELRAGGAAGYPASPGFLDHALAWLGLASSDKTAAPAPTKTASADTQ